MRKDAIGPAQNSWGETANAIRGHVTPGPMRGPILVIFALSIPFLSGCLDGTASVANEADEAAAAWRPPHTFVTLDKLRPLTRDPLSGDTNATHVHANAAQHSDQFNVERLAHLPGEGSQRFSELDIQGDYAYQCSGGGFRIIDISNRSHPVLVSTHSGTNCADLKATSDGVFVIVMGREIVDVRDKLNPKQVTAASGASCHMCYIKKIGEKEYFFAARDNRASHTVPPGVGISIFEFTREPPTLTYLSQFTVPPEKRPNTHMPDGDTFTYTVHDMTVYDDPILKKPVMLAAYWDLGVRIVDVSDPKSPREIGFWDDFKGDLGDIHTVGMDFIGSKRIIAAGTENGAIIDPVGSASGYSVGYVYLIDATDLSNLKTVGKWLNPGKHSSGRDSVGVYSMHNLQFVSGRVYAASYHAGLWIIDAAGFVNTKQPDQARTLQKNDGVRSFGFHFTTDAKTAVNLWDVVVKDGYTYGSDIGNGLHVLHFFGDPLGDPTFTSIG